MHPCVFAAADHGTHPIPCLETVVMLLTLAVSDRKAVFVRPAHFPVAMPVGADEQWHDALDLQGAGSTRSNARGILPVRLLQASGHTVELGPPTRPTLHWQSQGLQLFIERPPCRIYGCGILEWGFGLGLDTFQKVGLV